MWVSAELIEERDGVVRVKTESGAEIEVPADKFVEPINNDLVEMARIGKLNVDNVLRFRASCGLAVTKLGSHALTVWDTGDQRWSEESVAEMDALFSDIVVARSLWQEQQLVCVQGILSPGAANIMGVSSGMTAAMRLFDAVTGNRCFKVWRWEMEKYNLQLFGLDGVTMGRCDVLSVTAAMTATSIFTPSDIFQVGRILEACLLLARPAGVLEQAAGLLGLDAQDLRRAVAYRSEPAASDRLIHTPRSDEDIFTCRQALADFILRRICLWILEKVNVHGVVADGCMMIQHPVFATNGSWTDFILNYFTDKATGCSVASIVDQPVIGLLPLLGSAKEADLFVTKASACHLLREEFKRTAETSFALNHTQGSVSYDASAFMEHSKFQWRDFESIFFDSTHAFLAKLMRVAGNTPVISAALSRYSIKPKSGTGTAQDRIVSEASELSRLFGGRVKWIYFTDPTVGVDAGVLERIREAKEWGTHDIGLKESEYFLRYISVGIQLDRKIQISRDKVWIGSDEERLLNQRVIGLRASAMMSITSAALTRIAQSALLERKRAVLKIQRWVRRHVLANAALVAPFSPSGAGLTVDLLWRELVRAKESGFAGPAEPGMSEGKHKAVVHSLTDRVSDLEQLVAHQAKLLQEKDVLIQELTNAVVRNKSLDNAEMGLSQRFGVPTVSRQEKSISKRNNVIAVLSLLVAATARRDDRTVVRLSQQVKQLVSEIDKGEQFDARLGS